MTISEENKTNTTKTKEQKLKELEEKKKVIEAKISKIKNAQTAKSKKEETRKKIIVGGWFLSLVEKDQKMKELYRLFLENGVTGRDKKLFE